MIDDLVIRPAGPGDLDPILDLLRASLGEGSIPRSRAYWSWKHERNPFGSSPALVAEHRGEIVGLRVFMRWDWLTGGERVPAVRAVDTATHPDWRGRKIFSRLTLALLDEVGEEGASFVFNTPNDLSRPGYLKMGWSSVGRVSVWVRPRRPWRMLRALLPASGGEEGREADDETSPLEPVASLLERPEIEQLLEASRNSDRRLTTARSPEYLRWRYADIPGFEYGGASVFDGEDGAAIIGRIRRRAGMRELRICETLVGPRRSSKRLVAGLVDRMIRDAEPDYVAAMAAPRTSERRALLRAGFVPVPRSGPVLTVRPLSLSNGIDPLRRADWRLSIGDLELF